MAHQTKKLSRLKTQKGVSAEIHPHAKGKCNGAVHVVRDGYRLGVHANGEAQAVVKKEDLDQTKQTRLRQFMSGKVGEIVRNASSIFYLFPRREGSWREVTLRRTYASDSQALAADFSAIGKDFQVAIVQATKGLDVPTFKKLSAGNPAIKSVDQRQH